MGSIFFVRLRDQNFGKMGPRDQNNGKNIGINGSRIYHVTTLHRGLEHGVANQNTRLVEKKGGSSGLHAGPASPVPYPPVAAFVSRAHHARISSIQLFHWKVVGKTTRDNPERYCGGFEFTVLQRNCKNGTRGHGLMLRLLQVSYKSKFDSYGVRNSVLIISHITFFPTTFLEIESKILTRVSFSCY